MSPSHGATNCIGDAGHTLIPVATTSGLSWLSLRLRLSHA
jgi:hypothetical protein